MKLKSKYVDLAAGIVVIGLALFVFIASIGMKSFAAAQIEPQFVPRLTAFALFFLGALIIARWELARRRGTLPKDEEQKEKTSVLARVTPVITFVLLFLYIFSLTRLGFTISTMLYLTAQISLLSGIFTRKEILKNAIISVISSVTIYLFFSVAFTIYLPVGPWGF